MLLKTDIEKIFFLTMADFVAENNYRVSFNKYGALTV